VLEERGKHIVGQVIHSLVMDVVFDVEKVVCPHIRLVDGCIPDVLAGLDECRVVHQIALCVQIEVNDVVT
jgi:hypothetical protein